MKICKNFTHPRNIQNPDKTLRKWVKICNLGLIKELLENHSLKYYSIEVPRPDIGPKNPHQ